MRMGVATLKGRAKFAGVAIGVRVARPFGAAVARNICCSARGMAKPQIESEPKPPFPEKKLPKPGLEADLKPRPRYEARRYKPAQKLEGKIALITGGDSGIGRAVAVLYAREGADVAFTALPAERPDAEETRRAIEREGRRCL